MSLKKARTTATTAVHYPLGTDPGDNGTRGGQTAKQRLSQAANELGKYREEETWGENYSSHCGLADSSLSILPLPPPALAYPRQGDLPGSGPGA